MNDEQKVETNEVDETQTEAPVETQETQTEAPVETQEKPKAEKKGTYKIFLDAEGNEIERKPVTRGRPPRDSYKDNDGNLVCPHVEKIVVKRESDYITLDVEGNVLHREPRKAGRGRPKKGFVKQIAGDYIGDYVKVFVAEEAPPAAEEAPVASQEAPEVVILEPVDVVEDAMLGG